MDPNLVDKTTAYYGWYGKGHPWYTYIWCVLLRITIGIVLIYINNSYINNKYLAIYAIIVAVVFFSKFISNTKTWKVYIRNVLIYSIIAIMYKHPQHKDIAGMLIIIDALMGLQSRFIQSK